MRDGVLVTEDVVAFIEREFYIAETGAPLVLHPHQRAVLWAAFGGTPPPDPLPEFKEGEKNRGFTAENAKSAEDSRLKRESTPHPRPLAHKGRGEKVGLNRRDAENFEVGEGGSPNPRPIPSPLGIGEKAKRRDTESLDVGEGGEKTPHPPTPSPTQAERGGEITASGTRHGGELKYSTIVYSSTKKSGKTTIGAAVALWHAFRYPRGDIKIIGNDLKQADSRMMEAIRTCIELNPRMAAAVEQKRLKQTQHRIVLPNKTVIEAIPVDPRGESGSNPSAVFWTEVWAVKYQAGLQMFTEMTLSPTKRGRSFRFIESYAGYVGESPLLEHLYKMGVTNGRRIHDTIELYESADGHLFTYWNTLFRLPWQTDEYYAEEEAILTPSEFRRVHRNEWVSSENEFVPPEWWAACVGDVPPLDKYTPLVVALDAGVVSDTFALMAVSRDGDNVIVRYARAWKPDGKAVDFSEPEADLRRLCAEHNVVYIVYDPYQLADMAQRLRRDVGAVVEPFGQGEERAIADRRLYDMIRARRVVHDGNVLLTEHVTHANAQLSGDRLRLVKRTAGLKIDLAVALSMAAAKIMGLVV